MNSNDETRLGLEEFDRRADEIERRLKAWRRADTKDPWAMVQILLDHITLMGDARRAGRSPEVENG